MRHCFWMSLSVLLSCFAASAQTTDNADTDAIRRVAELYISAQPSNLETAFYPEANLYTTDEKGGLRTIPFHEYLERVKKNAAAAKGRRSTIGAIQHVGDSAVVEV